LVRSRRTLRDERSAMQGRSLFFRVHLLASPSSGETPRAHDRASLLGENRLCHSGIPLRILEGRKEAEVLRLLGQVREGRDEEDRSRRDDRRAKAEDHRRIEGQMVSDLLPDSERHRSEEEEEGEAECWNSRDS